MVLFGSYQVVCGKRSFELKCECCGEDIGNLTTDEVMALVSGKYGKVLCFDCEEKLCPACHVVEARWDGNRCTLCELENTNIDTERLPSYRPTITIAMAE